MARRLFRSAADKMYGVALMLLSQTEDCEKPASAIRANVKT
jgi:hypothetical protein